MREEDNQEICKQNAIDLKFRAWDFKLEKYHYFDGIFNKHPYIERSTVPQYDPCPVYHKLKVEHFSTKQDKNDENIYAGDILRDDMGDILEVKFGELPLGKASDCVCTYPAFYCKSYGQLGMAPADECQEIGDWMEIIGNVNETPELIGLKDKE